MTDKQELLSFYLRQPEPLQSSFLSLRDIILAQDKGIIETRKYGMPCFTCKGKVFCYLWFDQKSLEPYLLMVEGKLLHHPGLEQGSRKRMKILRINPEKDIDIRLINAVLQEALDLYETGLIKTKK